jgi:hypothetical protein
MNQYIKLIIYQLATEGGKQEWISTERPIEATY